MDEIDVYVGERLRAFRQSRRLSLDELARRVGVTYQQIQKYESGANRISASQLWRLSRALYVGVGAFFPIENDTSDRGTLYWASAIGRLDPEVRSPIVGLIDAIATSHER